MKNYNTWSHWEWINGFFLWDNGSLGPSIFSGKLGWKWQRKIGRETTLRYYTVYSYRRPTTKKETVHWWSHSEAFRCVRLSADSVKLWIWRLRCGLLVLLVWSDSVNFSFWFEPFVFVFIFIFIFIRIKIEYTFFY